MPDSVSVSFNSLMPGVSMRMPPSRNRCSDREVVVCLPLLPSLLNSAVSCSTSVSALIKVDLPTPEEPVNVTVWPFVQSVLSPDKELY